MMFGISGNWTNTVSSLTYDISTYVGIAGVDASSGSFGSLRNVWYFWLRFSNILRLRSSFSEYSEAPELLL